ncbi:hypothetical protein ES708_12611 [subsurface metagenome]
MHYLLIPTTILPCVNISMVVVLTKGEILFIEIYQVGRSAINAYAHNRVHI